MIFSQLYTLSYQNKKQRQKKQKNKNKKKQKNNKTKEEMKCGINHLLHSVRVIWLDISLLGLYFHSPLARENKSACSVKYFTISHSDSCNHIVLSHGCIGKLITLGVIATWAWLTGLRVFTVTLL